MMLFTNTESSTLVRKLINELGYNMYSALSLVRDFNFVDIDVLLLNV